MATFLTKKHLSRRTFLRGTFGEGFVEWSNSTPAFWPAFRRWQQAARRFSSFSAIRGEHPVQFGILCLFTGFDAVENWFVEGHVRIERAWVTLFVLSLVAYVLCRTAKKRGVFRAALAER